MSGTLGTRPRAIRRRTSKNGASVKTGEADGQEPQLRERKSGSQKQQKEASRRAAPDARERIPAPAERGMEADSTACRRPALSCSSIALSFDCSPNRPSGQIFLHKESQQNHRNHRHRRRGAALPPVHRNRTDKFRNPNR